MQQQESVAIFWDYGNCPVPSDVSGREIVGHIMSIAHSFGSVKQFKAYLTMSQPNSSLAHPNLRLQLQASGVSLMDCPQNRGNDIADKMLLVDMIAYAIDNPPPATIILIISEQDYSYAVSILRLRRYQVVVIAPPGAMMAQASVHLDWHSEVLHTPLQEPDPPNPRQPASCHKSDPTPFTLPMSRTQCMTYADDMGDNHMYGTYDKYRRGSKLFPTHLNGIGEPFTSQRYSEPSGRQTPAADSRAQSSLQWEKSSPPSPPLAYKTPEPVFVTEGNGLFESSTRTPSLPKGFPYSEPESHTGLKQPSFPHISNTGSSSSSISSIFQPPSIPLAAASKPYEPAKTPPPPVIPSVSNPVPNPSIPAVKPAPSMTPHVTPTKPIPSTSALSSSSASKGAPAPTPPTTGTKTKHASSNSTESLAPYFLVLAQRLQARQEALGQPRIPRTDIGGDLAKDKSVYGQAGVSNFAAFINLARAASVVDVGGSGNDQWVSLHPDWEAGNAVAS